jgi:hypothetical protein
MGARFLYSIWVGFCSFIRYAPVVQRCEIGEDNFLPEFVGRAGMVATVKIVPPPVGWA